MRYDAVVIGSGAGGLSAAVALANAGRHVLVLEQHRQPGGWSGSFQLRGYTFSPGVHYVGKLGPGERLRMIYEGLGVSRDLSFCELNRDGYDHLQIGDRRFDVPAGRRRYIERLSERFPRHRLGIEAFFHLIDRVASERIRVVRYLGGWRKLLLPLRVPHLLALGPRPLGALLRRLCPDPHLQAILGAISATHGVAPGRVPIQVHASTMEHYFEGAYYPRGGAASIPRAFVAQLGRAGGELRLTSAVERILIEGGRAVGVRLAGGETIRADRVISNADAEMTYRGLIGEEHLSPALRRRVAALRWSISCVCLFIATDIDLRGRGYDSGNYWYLPRPDIDGIYAAAEAGRLDRLETAFVSVPTLKDPALRSDGVHTLEVISPVAYDPFARWADQPWRRRDEHYAALKRQITDRLMQIVDRIVPGLRDRVLFCELGTPLTNHHFCRSHRGAMYGTAKIRGQVGFGALPIQTEIPGLYAVGASTLAHGVMGATATGLVAACKILGCGMGALLRQGGPPLTVVPSEPPVQLRAGRGSTTGRVSAAGA